MMPILAAAVGLLAALHYFRRRQWPDAVLALLAGLALAALLVHEREPDKAAVVTLNTEDESALRAGLANAAQAERLLVRGDGLPEAMWNDLPALPMEWQQSSQDKLWLDFPRSIALGRVFGLTVRRSVAPEPWSLQLLAENGQVLAEAKSEGRATALSLAWLPPVAESMVLTARLRNAAGKTIAEGPVPLRVEASVPLRLQGRFASPSFDVRALNQLLADSGAILDWRTQLGKTVARSETPSEVLSPQGIVIDAAYAEGLAPQALAALLSQVGEGAPMLILGGSASQAAFWQRAMALRLAPAQGEDPQRQAAKLQLAAAPLLPAAKNSEWRALAADADGEPWLSQRAWKKGRISWLSVSGWHRYAISEPMALAQWWQMVFDQSLGETATGKAWRFPDPMPLPGLRTEICADGIAAADKLMAGGAASVELLPRAARSGAACAAVWPERAGWLTVTTNGMPAAQLYVFATGDWPAWQRALRHDATARYAARSKNAAQAAADSRTAATGPAQAAALLPRWCWAVLFASAMLALWWRERR